MSCGVMMGIVFAAGWIPLFVFRAEAMSVALPHYSPGERLWVRLTPALISAHVLATCLILNATVSIAPWSAAGALGMFAAAIGFWFWGRVLIGPLRVRRLPDEPPAALRRDGAFAVVRHPLYFAYAAAAAAPLCLVPRLGLFCTWLLCLLALAVRAVQEERRLRAQVGAAYTAYCRDVKRLIPFVW